MNKLFSHLTRLAAVLAIVLGLSAVSPAVVHAQDGGPNADKRNQILEQGLVRLNDWKTKQAINLRHAANAGDKLQTAIDKAKGRGLDVAELETALSAYRPALARAQADHDAAAALLAAHTGFDANGKVLDPQAARQTLVDARKSLNDAHITLTQAVANLRAAVNDWRDHLQK